MGHSWAQTFPLNLTFLYKEQEALSRNGDPIAEVTKNPPSHSLEIAREILVMSSKWESTCSLNCIYTHRDITANEGKGKEDEGKEQEAERHTVWGIGNQSFL